MRRRTGFILSLLLVAFAAAGCLSPQATEDDTAKVGAVAAQFVEAVAKSDVSSMSDLLVYPFQLIFGGETIAFQNKEELIDYIEFGYDYATLMGHDVTITNVLAQGNYGSAIVIGMFDWKDNEFEDEWTETVIFDVKLTRSGNQWKVSMFEIVALGYGGMPLLVASQ